MTRILLSCALLLGCGAPKPRPSEDRVEAPASAAPQTEAPVIERPAPTDARVAVVPSDEPQFAGGGQVFADARDLFTLEENHRNSMAATGRAERAKHAFWLERIDGESAVRRHVHCSTTRVIEESFGGSTARQLDRLDNAGVEAGQWLLRVGPNAATSIIMYRHIVKHHRLAYLGRTRDGVALYRYVAPRRVPGGDGR